MNARLDCCAPMPYAPHSSLVHTCDERRDTPLSELEYKNITKQWREIVRGGGVVPGGDSGLQSPGTAQPTPLLTSYARHPSNHRRRTTPYSRHVCTPWCGHDIALGVES